MADRNASGRFKNFSRTREEELVAECRRLKAEGTGLWDYLGDWRANVDRRDTSFLGTYDWRAIDDYQSAILDTYNVTEETIRQIFETVRSLDQRAGSTLEAVQAILDAHGKLVERYATQISSENPWALRGSYFDLYFEYCKETYQYELLLDGEGFSSDELLGLVGKEVSSYYIDGVMYDNISQLLESEHFVSLLLSGEEVAIPLGPDTVFKYQVTLKDGVDAGTQLKFQLSEDAVRFKNFRTEGFRGSFAIDDNGKSTFGNSLGKISIGVNGEETEVEVAIGNVSIGNQKLQIGGDPVEVDGAKYSWNAGLKRDHKEEKVFYKETVDTEHMTQVATIEMGMRRKRPDGSGEPVIEEPPIDFWTRTGMMWDEHPVQTVGSAIVIIAGMVFLGKRGVAEAGAEGIERYIVVPLEKAVERAFAP